MGVRVDMVAVNNNRDDVVYNANEIIKNQKILYMNKTKFEQWVFENYTVDENPMARELLSNVLEYAADMERTAQYSFLCRIIPQVPKRIIKRLVNAEQQ